MREHNPTSAISAKTCQWGCLFLILAWATAAFAAQPKRVVTDSMEDFAAGELESIRLSDSGEIRPGPALDLVHDFKNMILWDAVRLPGTGDLIIGSGPKGQVHRLDRKGQATQLTAFTESDVYAVAVGPDGAIYAASSPDGKVFRRGPRGGGFEVWFEHGEKYVWDMAFDAKGRLLVATGETGKLFRVEGRKKGEVIFDAEQPHLRCLVTDVAKGFYVGTVGQGLVYWIRDGQKPVVVMDSGRTDIAAMAADEAGNVYAAAVGEKQESAKTNSNGSSLESVKITGIKGLITLSAASPENPSASGNKTSQPRSSAENSQPVSSEVYRIDPRHYPVVLHASPHETHSLAWAEDHLLAGTGDEGRFMAIYPDGSSGPLGKVDSKQVTALLSDPKGGWFLLGSNWGRVYQMGARTTQDARYLSKIIDSGLFARWGRFKVYGDAQYSIRTRSGNTAEPGNSWYDWSFLDGNRTASPDARYLQFEIILEEGSISRVDFTYLPQNQPPNIKEIKALEPGIGFVSLQNPPPPKKIQTSSQLLKTDNTAPPVVERFRPVTESGIRTIVWDADDPNGDELTYQVDVRRDDQDWERLADKVSDTLFSWDTSGWPDGIYYARVTASDSADNAAGQELQDTKVSHAWRIDHTAPEINILTRSQEGVRFRVLDEGGVLDSVAVSTNGRDYQVVIPEDGILDSENETFFVERQTGKPLYIRVQDENGNISGEHLPKNP